MRCSYDQRTAILHWRLRRFGVGGFKVGLHQVEAGSRHEKIRPKKFCAISNCDDALFHKKWSWGSRVVGPIKYGYRCAAPRGFKGCVSGPQPPLCWLPLPPLCWLPRPPLLSFFFFSIQANANSKAAEPERPRPRARAEGPERAAEGAEAPPPRVCIHLDREKEKRKKRGAAPIFEKT